MKYKYGVEYETSGKKPDLPDDIRVERKFEGGWSNCNFRCREYVNWSSTVAFRICDQRYKPVEVVTEIPENNQKTENVSDWYDYDKQQAIALPPVGFECQVYNELIKGESRWEGCKLLFCGKFIVVYDTTSCYERHEKIDDVKFRPLDWNRKSDEEKQKFVDKCYESAGGGGHDLEAYLMDLYDAGCRFTENKAAS